MIKILGIVIIYEFNVDDLFNNINRYLIDVDKLIIWQNSMLTLEDKNKINSLDNSERIVFLGNGENKGISFPINQVIKVFEGEYDYLLTMDQDSYWVNFTEYIKTIKEYDNKNSIYIYGPQTSAVILNETNNNYWNDKSDNIVDYVISSGAVYKMEIFKKVGLFKENYFIDAVDEEMCYRARKHNIETLKINKALLLQNFGEPYKYKILWKNIIYNKYSSTRIYYIVRNHIWLVREYKFNFKNSIIIIYNYVIRPIIMAVLFDRKPQKFKKILKGLRDGVFKTYDSFQTLN